MKEFIFLKSPRFIQNALITLYDYFAYKKRHGGDYNKYKIFFKESEKWSYNQLLKYQNKRLNYFMKKVYNNSPYYKKQWDLLGLNIDKVTINDLKKIPILSKEELRKNINDICVDKKRKIVSNTGGTTGKSLTVYFSKENAQERFACLDNFKNRFGWEFGKKTAWFSGKNILNGKDVNANVFWKTDFFYNIRYYSTFHINEYTAKYYIDNFNKYKPLYFSGFPSSITELAKISIKQGIRMNYSLKGVFPTAESVSEEDRRIIKSFYGCETYDQYASSEGAPFITQCENGHLHIEMTTGVFEIIDNKGKLSKKGELIVTPFATEATPLIRYRIGDSIELETKVINCYHKGPIVKKIHGRTNDFLYSRERGKINLGNLSNILKHVNGVKQLQFVQDKEDEIIMLIAKDLMYFDSDEITLIKEVKDRLGNEINIIVRYVDSIPREKSGKYRLVKNGLKI